jgi:hypothetical protein
MDNNEFRKLLHQLQDEIKNVRTDDEKGNQLLRDLDGNIRALLDLPDENPMQLHQSFTQYLESSLYHFEVTHPSLTALISKLLDTLSNAGI